MLSSFAKEYHPKNKNIIKDNIDWINIERDIDWKNIELDIHLENLRQDYENEIERENNKYRFVSINDNIYFNSVKFIFSNVLSESVFINVSYISVLQNTCIQ